MIEQTVTTAGPLKPERMGTGTVIFGFTVLIFLFLALVGDIGFQGDDWWIFGIPYWNEFPESLLIYAQESRRPIEGLYWISMYETFGLHEPAFLAGSLILLGASCILMMRCLYTAFPDYREWAIASGLLAFVISPMANLVYMLHTDNSRISCLFFWISVSLFQSWAKQSEKISRLIFPVMFYTLATLTYENCALLIFAVPFMAYPVFRLNGKNDSTTGFVLKLGLALFLGFGIFLGVRFLIFGGGAVGHKSLTPPLQLALSYLSVLIEYLSFPLRNISVNLGNLIWAGLFTFFTFMVLKRSVMKEAVETQFGKKSSERFNLAGMTLLSLSVLGFGMAPYLLAGYSPELGFTSQSRIFSSAGFGAAALICLPLGFCKGKRACRLLVSSCLSVFIFLSALSQISLRKDWIQAKIHRDNITKSLRQSIPQVRQGANFLFIDLQWYLGDNAVVFQGVDGLNEWIKIVFDTRDINGFFLYPAQNDYDDQETDAIISREGVRARGSSMHGPLPLDSLILIERNAERLTVLRSVTRQEKKIAANWHGVEQIETNYQLIDKD